MEQERRRNFLINTLYFLTIAAGVFVFCKFLAYCLMPFVIGAVIALIVQRPALIISAKTKIRRSVAAAVLALTLFVGTAVLIMFLGIKGISAAAGLFKEMSGLARELSGVFLSVRSSVDSFFSRLPEELTSFAAEMYESAFRAHYMRKYKGTFRKNDRFTGVEFDLTEADKIFADLKEGA